MAPEIFTMNCDVFQRSAFSYLDFLILFMALLLFCYPFYTHDTDTYILKIKE